MSWLKVGEVVTGLLKPVTGAINKRTERKQNQDTIKGKLQAQKQGDATQVTLTDAEWETVGQSMSNQSWKDEYVTVSLVSILNLFLLGGVLAAFGHPEMLQGVSLAVKTMVESGIELGYLISAVVLAAIGLKLWRA